MDFSLIFFDKIEIFARVLNDLFESTMYNNTDLKTYPYTIPFEQTSRIDAICDSIYGGTKYTEETMVMNNIINPFSVESGDVILFTDVNELSKLYATEPTSSTGNKSQILNINKSKSSTKRMSLLPPSVNPGIKQVDIDYNKKTITVLNKFK